MSLFTLLDTCSIGHYPLRSIFSSSESDRRDIQRIRLSGKEGKFGNSSILRISQGSRRSLCTLSHAAASDDPAPANSPGGEPRMVITERYRSKLETLYYCDTAVPEEKIEKPRNLHLFTAKEIGSHPGCSSCEHRGILECATCAATGLYIDPVLECQGILVKVRCMGCGGSGTVMCPSCGGRGHL